MNMGSIPVWGEMTLCYGLTLSSIGIHSLHSWPPSGMTGAGYGWLFSTVDHSVIRGLVSALLHFVVELPLSKVAGGLALQPVSHRVSEGSPHRPSAPCTRHANSVLSVLCPGSGFSAHGPAAVVLAGHLASDGPDEARQFPGHGSGDLALRLAGLVQVTVPGAKPFPCCPGQRLNPGRSGACLSLQMRRLPGREPVGPCRFHQDPANMAVAGLRDRALPTPGSRAVLARNQAEKTHQLPRAVEPGDIPELGQHRDRGDHADAPQTDQRLHHRV